MVTQTKIDTCAIDGFAAAIAAQDFELLAESFSPGVRFRALTPGSTWGHIGSTSAIETLKGWFGVASAINLLANEIEQIGDRIRLAYRFRLFEDNVWNIVEQQAYCIVTEGRISDISIVCSGYQPEG